MWFFRRNKTTPVTRQDMLAGRPLQLVEPRIEQTADGGAKLTVKLRPGRSSRWLFRLPDDATKTFELDAIGWLVWQSSDGKTSVQQIICKVAKRYNLNLREAEVPTLKFLQTLVKKGLVGMSMRQKKEQKDA